MTPPPLFLSHATQVQAFRIAPEDSNYFAILHDATTAPGFDNVCVIEIFEKDGRTPPNSHRAAYEFFYVLAGEGRAHCAGETVDLRRGSAMLLPPGGDHVIENVGDGKLYTLTVMTPDEGFAALIRAGTPVELDNDDIAILSEARRHD